MKIDFFSGKKKENKMDASAISVQSRKIIQDLINMEERSTLQDTFYKISRKTGLDVNQIKRIYYNEGKYIYAHIWEQLKASHRKLIDKALKNMEHKQMLIKQQILDFDENIAKDKERMNEFLKKNK